MAEMNLSLIISLGGLLFIVLIVVVLALRWERARSDMTALMSKLAERQEDGHTQLTQRLVDQERFMSERLHKIGQQVGTTLQQSSEKTQETLTNLRERLAVMDSAQQKITELSTQMVGLQEILSNKQARGAFGEIQLQDLVQAVMPADSYSFQATVGDGRRVDCLLKLPNPPGPIAIDAKFPLESYNRLQQAQSDSDRVQAARQFSTDIRNHVRAIAEKYIVPGETGEAALMFLPSEAVYAELHANYGNVVEESFRLRVFIVSPTTLWATLNTVRAVFRDVRMREQAHVIQRELHTMLDDVGRLAKRVDNLDSHFRLATKDIDEIKTSSSKIERRAEKIQDLELEEEGERPAVSGPEKASSPEKASGQGG